MITPKIDLIVQRFVEQNQFSGIVAIEQSGARIYDTTHGYAHHGWKIPNTLSTRFRVASIGKVFTAVCFLQLVEEGIVTLDTRIHDILDLGDGTRIPESVTLQHLLTMTSGIADWFNEEQGTDEDWARTWTNIPIYEVRRLEDYLPFFIDRPPISRPGEKYRHCNAGYILAGLAIEHLTDRPYFSVVSARIFSAGGMRSSAFLALDDIGENVAEGYSSQDATLRKNIYSTTPEAASDGGAISTGPDLLRFLRNLRAGNYLRQAWTLRATKPVVYWSDGKTGFKDMVWHYGYGLIFNSREDGTIIRYGHTGEEVGVSGRLYHYPDADLDLVVLGNHSNCTGDLCWQIHDEVTREFDL